MATWLTSLGNPVGDSYSVQSKLPIIETPMETGPQRRTRIATQYISQVSCQFFWTATQMGNFQTYFDGTLNAGANWIDDFPLDTGYGIFAHHSRIASFSKQRIGTSWQVTMQVETDERASS